MTKHKTPKIPKKKIPKKEKIRASPPVDKGDDYQTQLHKKMEAISAKDADEPATVPTQIFERRIARGISLEPLLKWTPRKPSR